MYFNLEHGEVSGRDNTISPSGSGAALQAEATQMREVTGVTLPSQGYRSDARSKQASLSHEKTARLNKLVKPSSEI